MPHLLRRAVALTALSALGLALLTPLAARSAPPAVAPVPEPLLAGLPVELPQTAFDRGGTTVREASLVAPSGAETFAEPALPTPATAPMEATLVVIATPTPAPVIARGPQLPAVRYDGTSVWDDLARCESGGNWAINTGNGYYGGLQFSYSTWHGYDGGEFAEYPHEATREQQITVAERLRAARGYQPWPACRVKLGLP